MSENVGILLRRLIDELEEKKLLERVLVSNITVVNFKNPYNFSGGFSLKLVVCGKKFSFTV